MLCTLLHQLLLCLREALLQPGSISAAGGCVPPRLFQRSRGSTKLGLCRFQRLMEIICPPLLSLQPVLRGRKLLPSLLGSHVCCLCRARGLR